MDTGSARRAGGMRGVCAPPVVARRALFARLSAGVAGGVTLVSAPPGSGKTVLLRSWIGDAGIGDRIAWVPVERGERDAQRFWLSVIRELRAAVGAEGFLEKLAPTPRFDGNAAIERVVSELGSLEEPVVLVIDDLHELSARDAREQFERLLARRPPLLRVVLATRRDPLGLHRLRLAGELTEIRASDLRFTLEETRELLAACGIALSGDGVALLQARTEGWAAGLRLAVLSLAGHPEPERFVAEFSGTERTIADYLLAEVLARQPDEVRRLLLRTSILERISGPLADVLTGASGSERILQDLEAANAFVVALDAGRTWFRYHHLFGDLLRLELRRTDPDAIAGLHRAAAGWYAERGDVVEAVRHAQAARDWPQAALLLADNCVSLWLNGQEAMVGVLLEGFPAEAAADPELAPVVAADRLTRGSLDELAACVAYGERRTAAVPDDRRRRFEATLSIFRLALALRRGDLESASENVRPMLALAEPSLPGEIALSNDVRAFALMELGMVEVWPGRYAEAEQHLEQGLALARRIGRPYIEIGCLAHLAMGDRSAFSMGRQRCMEAIALADSLGWGANMIVAVALGRMGGYDAWQGSFDEAERWLDRANQVVRPETMPAPGLLMHLARGMAHTGRDRHEQALGELRQAERLEALMVGQHVLAVQVRQFLVQTQLRLGDTAGARTTLEEMLKEHRDSGEALIAVASLHLAEGNARAAVEALASVLVGSAPAPRDYTVVQALLLEALARDRLGEPRAAESAVERALDLAEPDALVFPFVMVRPRDLLERHPRHRTAHAALLSDILDVLAGSSLPARDGDSPALREELSNGEVRVLRYLPSNLSAPEIAAELYVSTSTVKTHLRHIYAKLGAHRRTEAVERARALGLLGPSARHLR